MLFLFNLPIIAPVIMPKTPSQYCSSMAATKLELTMTPKRPKVNAKLTTLPLKITNLENYLNIFEEDLLEFYFTLNVLALDPLRLQTLLKLPSRAKVCTGRIILKLLLYW